MARRRPPPPPPDDRGGPPAELRRFILADWIDETEPIPNWWTLDDSVVSWSLSDRATPQWYRYLRGRRRYMDAVRAWRDEHGIDYWDWDRVRGACDATCQRAYKHVHGG
jgi:hypothetical protein